MKCFHVRSRRIDPTCAHKLAMYERPRLTLDSYFEKASGSGSEASTQMWLPSLHEFSMQDEVPIVSELPRFAQEGLPPPAPMHPPGRPDRSSYPSYATALVQRLFRGSYRFTREFARISIHGIMLRCRRRISLPARTVL